MSSKQTYWKKIPLIDNILLKLLRHNREEIHNIFLENTNYNNKKSILDVGTSAEINKNHNFILQKTKKNKNVFCLTNQKLDLIFIKQYPQIKKIFIKDGRDNKLKKKFFDIVYSSATLEHVGSFKSQKKFIKECFRVCKNYVFITTPNRYYPLDFHTKIPLIHWLPKKIHRKILNTIGLRFYAKEKNLNLLGKNDIRKMLSELNINNYKIIDKKFLFFTSNFILVIKIIKF